MLTIRRGIQVQQIREVLCWRAWYLALTSVFSTEYFSPSRLPGNANPSSPVVSSASLITFTNWQTKANLGSDHLLILISLQMYVTINPIQHRSNINLKKANCDRYSREIKDKLSKRRLPANCQNREKTFACHQASHHIPSGRHRLNTEQGPTEILEKMRVPDDLRSRDYLARPRGER